MLKACRYTLNPAAMAAATTSAMNAKMQEPDAASEKNAVAPKLGNPGVCPDCGAADQTGKFCEFCGAKIG